MADILKSAQLGPSEIAACEVCFSCTLCSSNQKWIVWNQTHSYPSPPQSPLSVAAFDSGVTKTYLMRGTKEQRIVCPGIMHTYLRTGITGKPSSGEQHLQLGCLRSVLSNLVPHSQLGPTGLFDRKKVHCNTMQSHAWALLSSLLHNMPNYTDFVLQCSTRRHKQKRLIIRRHEQKRCITELVQLNLPVVLCCSALQQRTYIDIMLVHVCSTAKS